MAALDAGVKSIEHGVYLDEEVAAKMKEKDAILVPTRHIVEAMYAGDDDLDPRQRVKPERTIQLSRWGSRSPWERIVLAATGTMRYLMRITPWNFATPSKLE